MHPKLNFVWLIILAVAGVFSLFYIWQAVFPGRVDPEAGRFFSAAQVQLGREYSQVQRLLFIGGFIAQAALLAWLAFSHKSPAFSRWFTGTDLNGYWLKVLLFFLLLWLLLRLADLPFTLYGDFFWQHRWGFSNQTLNSWWKDYFIGAGIDLALSAIGAVLLLWAISRLPAAWWLAAAVFISLWLIVQSLIWPVVVSPIFNRFEPVEDRAVLAVIDNLSRKAGLKIEQVLVMDASRRTNKANAYFTGLGKTKRIVIYDTLLKNYPLDQVEAVLAHEMAHWSRGHLFQSLILGIAGNFILWGFLFILLRKTMPPALHCQPGTLAVIFLFFLLVSFACSPLQNAFSRSMEEDADRLSIQLTGNIQAAVQLQKDLAVNNLSDVSPPAFIRWFSYSHPPAPARINNMRQTEPQTIR